MKIRNASIVIPYEGSTFITRWQAAQPRSFFLAGFWAIFTVVAFLVTVHPIAVALLLAGIAILMFSMTPAGITIPLEKEPLRDAGFIRNGPDAGYHAGASPDIRLNANGRSLIHEYMSEPGRIAQIQQVYAEHAGDTDRTLLAEALRITGGDIIEGASQLGFRRSRAMHAEAATLSHRMLNGETP